jgi:hypothetical protein
MPSQSEILEVRVQAAVEAYRNMDPPNLSLACPLHNAPPKRIRNRVKAYPARCRSRPAIENFANTGGVSFCLYGEGGPHWKCPPLSTKSMTPLNASLNYMHLTEPTLRLLDATVKTRFLTEEQWMSFYLWTKP